MDGFDDELAERRKTAERFNNRVAIQEGLKPGDLVLCDAAIRDEGVSHHYLPPGRLATAPVEATAALGAAMREAGHQFRTGTSWTIDTPYRETLDEVRHYQAEGVLCVEMEAAALFAVAERTRVIGMDLVEVNPLLDVPTGLTSYLAAHTVIEFLGRICDQPMALRSHSVR